MMMKSNDEGGLAEVDGANRPDRDLESVDGRQGETRSTSSIR
jgi:hypothetical protein